MIETNYILTNTEVEDILHNMSATELWQLNADVEPIKHNRTQLDVEKSQKIYAIMDLTDLAYENVACIVENPQAATLQDIHIYCKALNINTLGFIEKALS
jgi:hypothetical protein